MTVIRNLPGRPLSPAASPSTERNAPRDNEGTDTRRELLPKPSWNPFKSNFVDRPKGRPCEDGQPPGASPRDVTPAPGRRDTQTKVVNASVRPELPLVDLGTVTSSLVLGDDVELSALELNLNVAHTWSGDLVVKVTSPSGKTVTIANREGGSRDDVVGRFDLSAFEGERSRGKWTLTVEDKARRDTGTLRSWGLTGIGEAAATKPTTPSGPQPLNGAPVVVVLDGGVEATHEDLDSAMWRNPLEIEGDGLDNDGNGYEDDVFGIDVARGSGKVDRGDGSDHGTHVAGIIASEANGIGNTGVAAGKAEIMAIGGMYEGRDMISNFEVAVDYMVKQKARGVNIRVVNASFGQDVRSSRELARWNAATEKLLDADILLVAATANGNGSNMDRAPGDRPANANLPNVVVVAALDRNEDELADFSSYGPKTVDLAAPGEDIVSTVPRGKWDVMSGTSMATPHVAGAAALMFAANPALTAVQAAELLLQTAVKDPDLRGRVLTGGKLDVQGAVRAAEALRPRDADDVVVWR